MTRDLPEGVADAEPAGGWTSAHTADGSTAESTADALREVQEEAPDEETSTGVPAPDGAPSTAPERGDDAADPYVESAEIQQGLDPDMVTDAQAEQRDER